ncbi:MAG: nuclear transport factor 2 family protein [Aquihabitans sp.]
MSHDARAIEKLIYAYAERIDAGDFEGVAELFNHGRIQAAPGMVFEGAAAVLGLYQSTTRLHGDGTPRTRHLTTNVVVEVDDQGLIATARSYFTVLQQTDHLPLQPIVSGHYCDSFRNAQQQWHFDTREIHVDLAGDLSDHLLFDY